MRGKTVQGYAGTADLPGDTAASSQKGIGAYKKTGHRITSSP